MLEIKDKSHLANYLVPPSMRYFGAIFRRCLQGSNPGGDAYIFPDEEITLYVDILDSNLFFSKIVHIESKIISCCLINTSHVHI